MNIKIMDFGFSSIGPVRIEAFGGTKAYMSPEVLERAKYNGFKADIFSLGVLLFTSTIGNFPFV
jgi:serine/threonine protein kinase